MSDIIPNLTSTSSRLMATLAELNSEPTWSLDKRRAAAIAMRHLPVPDRHCEAWQHTPCDNFLIDTNVGHCLTRPEGYGEVAPSWSNLSASSAAGHADSAGTPNAAGQADSASTPNTGKENSAGTPSAAGADCALPEGVTACSIVEAMRNLPEAEKFFFLNNAHQRDFYSAVNAAWRNGGIWLDATPNLAVNDVLLATHRPEMDFYAPHSVVRLNAASSMSCIEHFKSGEETKHSYGNIELHLAPEAALQYALVLDWGHNCSALTQLHITLQEGSQAELLIIALNGRDNKVLLTSDIVGSNASCKVYGLTYADGEQNFEVNLLQQHHAGRSASDVLYHCAVNDSARSVFAGNIWVAGHAQKSDAYQKNRNLLLSPKARAFSQPQLEIIADDVRCTHGANFTSYDPEQQFYLQSRGIEPQQAQALIVSGFLQEIVGHFAANPGRSYLADLVNRRLHNEWMSFSEGDFN